MSTPFPLHVGPCGGCKLVKLLHPLLCAICLERKRNHDRLESEREKLLDYGLRSEAPHTAPSSFSAEPAADRSSRGPAPLFLLCVTYLTNNADSMSQEAIDCLPTDVRYIIFMLLLWRGQRHLSTSPSPTSPSSSSAAGAHQEPYSRTTTRPPRLRLAKRFLLSRSSGASSASTRNVEDDDFDDASFPALPSSPSFVALDLSMLVRALPAIQQTSLFDYATSFGRPSVAELRVLSLSGLDWVTDGTLRTIAACMPYLRTLDLSFCSHFGAEGLAALHPLPKKGNTTRRKKKKVEKAETKEKKKEEAEEVVDSWELLADEMDGSNGDKRNADQDDDEHQGWNGEAAEEDQRRAEESELVARYQGLPCLYVKACLLIMDEMKKLMDCLVMCRQRLGLFGCTLFKPELHALAQAYAAMPTTLTVYTSLSGPYRVIQNELPKDEVGGEWDITDAEASSLTSSGTIHHHHQQQHTPVLPSEEERERVVFVEAMLNWTALEEEAIYSFRGWQLEEIAELRARHGSSSTNVEHAPILASKRVAQRPSLSVSAYDKLAVGWGKATRRSYLSSLSGNLE